MQASNLGLQKWGIAIYMMTVGIKGTSSMRLHRDLKMTQATAWHLMQRIRQAFVDAGNPLLGPVEVDEPWRLPGYVSQDESEALAPLCR